MATATFPPRTAPYAEDQAFYVRLAIFIAVVTVFCFVQLVARGLIDPRNEPVWVHLHAFAMVGWLCLFVAQNILATGNLRLHRKLGRAGIVLAGAIIPLAGFTVFKSFQLHRTPEDYNHAWALSQEVVEALAFIGLVGAGISARRNPQYHRRLMLGATIVVAINPALSRLLPEALGGDPVSGWFLVLAELGVLAVLARHDRRVLGAIHPATIAIGGVILASQLLMIAGGNSVAVQRMAQALG